MIINKLKLKNFRSYENEVEFNFTPVGDKNIVIIGGENGAGKSSIFEAIKLCIYGPTVYGYQGFNSSYINKIKSNINYNTFKANNIDVFISLLITLPEGVQQNSYELIRSWTFENKKLVEKFAVLKNGIKLEAKELDIFENYLKSLIPPNLFDFFFFDGEELSDFFSGKNASLHLKESILRLCNYDTLDILKKQLVYFQKNSSKSSDDLSLLESQYSDALQEEKTLKKNLENAEDQLISFQSKYESLLVDKTTLDDDFRKSGGLLESERTLLKSQEYSLENERTDINIKIKDFCNDILPFLLVSNKLSQVKTQIIAEESLSAFNSIKNKLTTEVIHASLLEANIINNSSSNIKILPDLILSKVFDVNTLNGINEIHRLSSDDKDTVVKLVDDIIVNNEGLSTTIINGYNRITVINDELKSIRKKIESSVNQDVLETYLRSNLELNEKLALVNNDIKTTTKKINEFKELILPSENKVKKLKNIYLESIQSNSTLEYSNKIMDAIEELLKDLTKDKLREIESSFIEIFNKLIRKESYIDGIEINENYEATLYVNKEYSFIEISNLISNLGLDELEKRYGNKFIDGLLEKYHLDNKRSLTDYINNNLKLESIILKTKINVNSFSKGEKQLFILCLIWSLIKSSGVEIPFIIDTPYARIDETHRCALTNYYLPNISKQVIILSTNEEIDKNLYKTIKPYVSNEYLLEYQNLEGKTNVIEGYFFEV